MKTGYSGSYTIKKGTKLISGGAFKWCSSLTSVTIPNSVKSIGESAFDNCTSLTSVTIPSSVTSIGSYAFSGCTSLTSITIGNSVTWIGGGAFSACTSLTSITIPNSVTSIGSYTFRNCYSLTSITIPNRVTSIDYGAFYGCNKIKALYIPNSVEKIGSSALANTTSLTDLYYGGSKRKWYDQVYVTSDDDLKYVNIHFDAKVVTKNAKKATYFAKGYTGDKVVGSIVLEKGKAIAQLKLATPKFSVTAGKKLFKVKYNKVTGATGFQLRYKLNGSWTTKNFDTKKSVTKTINKLKKGKNYTVQVRAFVKSGKKTAYSGWASAKKVKIK